MAVDGLRRNAKRWRSSVIAGRIAVERSRDLRRALGRREGVMGATHRDLDLDESLSYVDRVFEDYLRYGPFDLADLEGKRVLELGSGDNFGVALRLTAAGAEVAAVDRFLPVRDREQQLLIYRGLLPRLEPGQRARLETFERGLANGNAIEEQLPVDVHEGVPIEEAPARLGAESFDAIVSRAVLEHVYDLDTAFASMDRLLKPGGWMIHEVDLRDHGLFSEGGQHELTFLTIPDRIYRWMGEESAGLPNRRLEGWYRDALDRLGYSQTHLVSHLVGVTDELEPHVEEPAAEILAPVLQEVEEIRPRLLPRYRSLPARELAVAGFSLVAQKPN